MTSATITIRPYAPGDEAGIVATFNRVFREVCGPDFEDREIDHWRWSFGECPAGMRVFVAAAPCGTIAAHYACVPHRMQSPLGELTFLSTVDSMVHPDFRAGLKRPGLFVATTRAFQSASRDRGDTLTYGYPVRAAERIGKRYLDYETLGVVDYLARSVGAARVEVPSGVTVTRAPDLAGLDDVAACVAREKSCMTIRDDSFLAWRYVDMPRDPYVRLVARRGDAVAGAAVVRPKHELVPGACTIAEWLVPEADAETAAALLAAAEGVAREHARSTLLAVFPARSPEFARFREHGFVVEPSANTLERRMTIVRFDDRITLEWLQEHWWFTLGDSDLV